MLDPEYWTYAELELYMMNVIRRSPPGYINGRIRWAPWLLFDRFYREVYYAEYRLIRAGKLRIDWKGKLWLVEE